MAVYEDIVDQVSKENKNTFRGQISLFEFVTDEEKQQFEVSLPDIGEYDKELLYAYEKEVSGVYLTGHPLESYVDIMKKHITATSNFFKKDDDETKVINGARETIGGMLTNVTTRLTRKNQIMVTAKIEDLLGSVEVIIFPKIYEGYKASIYDDAKVFLSGRVSEEVDADSKLIVDKITEFVDMSKKIYIKVDNYNSYTSLKEKLVTIIGKYPGKDSMYIYLEEEKSVKQLPRQYNISTKKEAITELEKVFGSDNIKVVE